MDLLCIKMGSINLNKNKKAAVTSYSRSASFLPRGKKAFDINTEILIYIFAIIVMSLVIGFSQYTISDSQKHIEKMAPNLTYQYPAVFVKSFLMLKIDDSDIKDLNLDVNKNYYVYNLIYLGSDDAKDIVDKKKDEFIMEMNNKNSLKSFENFAKISINQNELLKIDYSQSSQPNLELALENNNYVFYFKGSDQKFRQVYFRG